MSLATDYATAVSALAAAPSAFIGPGGSLVASVLPDGNCKIVIPGREFVAPAAVMVAFATWVNATFA